MSEMLFTTNDAAKMLSVDKSTIKRWTDEGKIQCSRTPGGHRKFTADDLYNFMSQFNFGKDLGQKLPDYISDEFIIRSIIQKKEYNFFHSVCFSAAIKGKKDELIGLCNQVHLAGLPIALMFDHIVIPTIKKIENLFVQHKLSISEYHLAQNALSSAIVQLSESIQKKEKNFKTIVCTSIETRNNDIELKALNTLLEIEGYTVLNLGIRMTAEAINQFIAQTKPFALYLYTFNLEISEMIFEEIKKIVVSAKMNGAHCVLGGAYFQGTIAVEGLDLCSSFMEFLSIQYNSVKEFEKF